MINEKAQFVVPGKPVGKGRPRFRRNGQYVVTYTPEKTRAYEEFVLTCWRQQSNVKFPRGTPIKVTIRGHFAIPKNMSKEKQAEMLGAPYMHKCDADNLAKAVIDAISGVVFYDDAEIVSMIVTKEYAENPCVEVEVTECERNP